MIIKILVEVSEVVVPIKGYSRTFRIEIFSVGGSFESQISERVGLEGCLSKGAFQPHPLWAYTFRLLIPVKGDSLDLLRDAAIKQIEVETTTAIS